jgi:ATP-dependent RNA helicase RhlB
VPTRELAIQIEKEAKMLGRFLDLTIGCFYGGDSYYRQEKLLNSGVDIMIGTPGRLIDFGKKNKINFREIEILIIDEADRLFDMGFLPDIRWMLKRMPKYSERQTMLFSATLGHRARQIAWEYMNEPVEIILNPDRITVEKISQVLYHVESKEKMPLLLGILKNHKPGNTLIFTNTKQAAYTISKRLECNGYQSQYLIGDLPQKKRQQIIEDIKSGRLQYLVATDVAARGLHIDNLDLVVNYDLPEDPESYVHRIGRTGRIGKSGKAITLACEKFVMGLEALESFTDMKISVAWADEKFLESDVSEGMHFRLDTQKNDKHPEKFRRKNRSDNTTKRMAKSSLKRDLVNGKEKNKRRAPKKETLIKVQPGSSDEDRLEFYSRKYGENFKIVN